MKQLSPQKKLILSHLRSLKWVCGSAWLGKIKDDRARLHELAPYLREKGFILRSEPCKGTACGKSSCPLYKRKAVKIEPKEDWATYNKTVLHFFNEYEKVSK